MNSSESAGLTGLRIVLCAICLLLSETNFIMCTASFGRLTAVDFGFVMDKKFRPNAEEGGTSQKGRSLNNQVGLWVCCG